MDHPTAFFTIVPTDLALMTPSSLKPEFPAFFLCPARSMPAGHSPEKTRSMPLRQCRFLVPDVPYRALALVRSRRQRILYLSSLSFLDITLRQVLCFANGAYAVAD